MGANLGLGESTPESVRGSLEFSRRFMGSTINEFGQPHFELSFIWISIIGRMYP